MAEKTIDIVQWLKDKFDVKNPWNSQSISGMLDRENIERITWTFFQFPTQTKLKILMAIFYIPKRSLFELSREIRQLLERAMTDKEESVAMMAEIMIPYPLRGTLDSNMTDSGNMNVAQVIQEFNNAISGELEKIDGKYFARCLPMECYFLNKTSLKESIGIEVRKSDDVKHFEVKHTKKTKADLLRETLLGKVPIKITLPRNVAGSTNSRLSSRKRPWSDDMDFVPARVRGMPKPVSRSIPQRASPQKTSMNNN